jgi:hypothetical protein
MSWSGNKRTKLFVFQRPPARESDAAPRLLGTISGSDRARDAVNGGRELLELVAALDRRVSAGTVGRRGAPSPD